MIITKTMMIESMHVLNMLIFFIYYDAVALHYVQASILRHDHPSCLIILVS